MASLELKKNKSQVLPHERTLSGPKKDRLKLIKMLHVNTSPIFGTVSDENGKVRNLLQKCSRSKPLVRGQDTSGVRYRLWRVAAPEQITKIEKLFKPRKILLADGHHRFRVACRYAANHRSPEAGRTLIYICAEQDPGLLMFATHRIVSQPKEIVERIHRFCRIIPCASLKEMDRLLQKERSLAAFGYYNGSLNVAIPFRSSESSLGVEWVRAHLFRGVSLDRISYSRDAQELLRWAKHQKKLGIFLKEIKVSDVRRWVEKGRLLPQKSTFFYPKIATGLLFREMEEQRT
ncbi:MAG: DUF1015 family protein [Elusimicrobia bacterium]|nr:DUF1015 family protein [Elusimicrobiota bacterium]